MELKTDFGTFLGEIRPTQNQRNDLQTGHTTLRERLNADEGLKKAFVSDFLQGSYRRATAVRPKSDRCSDVDIVVVTKLSESEYTPAKAMDQFMRPSGRPARQPPGTRNGPRAACASARVAMSSAWSYWPRRSSRTGTCTWSDL